MHILSASQFNKTFIDKLFEFSSRTITFSSFEQSLRGKILLNVFFEASTRTSLSFETAMKQLGGEVISFNQNVSSMIKGESYEDTIRTLAVYGDIMILRDPNIDNLQIASKIVKIPLINAGNGSGEHPTQALLDLYTIYKKFDNINNKNILFMGDIKNSRTIHSLLDLLKFYPKIKTYLLAYYGLESEVNLLKQDSTILSREDEIDFNQFDVIYMTRLQKERELDDSQSKSADFIIDKLFLRKLKKDCIIMHPLPRNNEIDPEIDDDERVYYFKQMENGVRIRKTLIYMILNKMISCRETTMISSNTP